MLYRTSIRHVHRKNINEDPTRGFLKEINTVGKSKTNYAQGKSKSHKKEVRRYTVHIEGESEQIYRVCLRYSFFHLNSIRLLLWNWHTLPQGKSMACSFFDFLHFPSFLFSSRSTSNPYVGIVWNVLSKEKNERATVRWHRKKISDERQRKKYSKSFELVLFIYFFFFLGYFIFKACDLIRLSLLFLYKQLGDAIHRHHNCNRNNMIISKSEPALAPAAKINHTHTHKHTSHPYWDKM